VELLQTKTRNVLEVVVLFLSLQDKLDKNLANKILLEFQSLVLNKEVVKVDLEVAAEFQVEKVEVNNSYQIYLKTQIEEVKWVEKEYKKKNHNEEMEMLSHQH